MKKRKNYALFSALTANEYSNQVLAGASKAAKELDINLYDFPMGLIDGDYSDIVVNPYYYQYNILKDFFNSTSIDGVILEYGTIASKIDSSKKDHLLSLIKDIPTILLSETAEGHKSITFDNLSGLIDVINHLINDHHCKKIGFVSGPTDNQDANIRLQTYKDVLDNAGIYYDDTWIAYGNFSTHIDNVVEDFLDLHPDVEAIVFANDGMASCGYKVIKQRGLEVGKDILVTGFDDRPSSIFLDPPLTTVNADASELGYNAVYALTYPEQYDSFKTIPSKLVIRNSCGCHDLPMNDGDEFKNNYAGIIANAYASLALANKQRLFSNEMVASIRDTVYNQDSISQWLKTILHSLRRLKYKKSYILLHEKPFECSSNYSDNFNLPETISLSAYYVDDEDHIFDIEEAPKYNVMDLFSYDIFHTEYSSDLFVIPLFYCQKQYGLFICEYEIDSFQYSYDLAGLISNSLELINIHLSNEAIKNELAAANEYKSQFLANMSHEVRTPINAIMGMNEMIQRESEDTNILEYSNDIRIASDTLLNIVNDILDITKIESGKMTLNPISYNLQQMVTDVFNQITFRAKGKDLSLKLNINENLPSILYGDDIRIKQIIMNLMTNAVKYTHKGSVTLSVDGCIDDETANVTFKVVDTGIGIKPENIHQLFEKFERIEENRNRNIEGTGLGMNITISLLELMGSKLEVRSEYNKGSEFSFTITQPIIDETSIKTNLENSKDVTATSPKGCSFVAPSAKILLVDDNRINRTVIKNLLKKSKLQIDEAENGLICLEKYQANDYDLILLDHMMPEMDGMETFKVLKETNKYIEHRIPVIVLTANAIVGVRTQYLEAGFDDYLSKPVVPDALEIVLTKHLPSDKVNILD